MEKQPTITLVEKDEGLQVKVENVYDAEHATYMLASAIKTILEHKFKEEVKENEMQELSTTDTEKENDLV